MQGKENGNVLSKRKCIFNSREKLKKKIRRLNAFLSSF